jgi:hypothetical protein
MTAVERGLADGPYDRGGKGAGGRSLTAVEGGRNHH